MVFEAWWFLPKSSLVVHVRDRPPSKVLSVFICVHLWFQSLSHPKPSSLATASRALSPSRSSRRLPVSFTREITPVS